MSKRRTFGTLIESTRLEWKIPNFSSLPDHGFCESPSFTFANTSLYLCVHERISSAKYLGVYLFDDKNNYPSDIAYSLSLKKSDGSLTGTKTYLTGSSSDFIAKSHLRKMELELLPEDTLTIICDLKHIKDHPLAGEAVRSAEMPIVEILERMSLADTVSLCDDYKKMFLDGQNHDLILKVGDQEFPAHRDILRARSRVFESMLNHNMKEKNSGVIHVPDCEPQAMEQFLLYVYCGKIEKLDENIMLGLYYVADKYDISSLKEKCCDFINQSLSPTNICDVAQLALNHNDENLLDCVTGYFSNNLQDILRTVEWQTFLRDNLTIANDILIRSTDKLKIKKK